MGNYFVFYFSREWLAYEFFLSGWRVCVEGRILFYSRHMQSVDTFSVCFVAIPLGFVWCIFNPCVNFICFNIGLYVEHVGLVYLLQLEACVVSQSPYRVFNVSSRMCASLVDCLLCCLLLDVYSFSDVLGAEHRFFALSSR